MFRLLVPVFISMIHLAVSQITHANNATHHPLPGIRLFITHETHSEPKGEPFNGIIEMLNKRGVAFDIVPLTWEAAFSRTKARPNTMFLSIDRTREREKMFHWIAPHATNDYFLYGTKGSKLVGKSLQEIIDGQYSVSCARYTSQCEMLVEKGIASDKIVRIMDADALKRSQALINGRTDMTVLSPLNFNSYEIDTEKLVQLVKIGETTSYLVANLKTDPRILELLKPVE